MTYISIRTEQNFAVACWIYVGACHKVTCPTAKTGEEYPPQSVSLSLSSKIFFDFII